jgi:hypothetical protein
VSIAPCTGLPFTTYTGLINCEPNCNTAADCPGPSTTCQPAACVGGLCVTQNAPEGTSCTDAGVTQICNGIGSCVPFSFDVVRVGSGSGTTGLPAAPVFVEQRSITDGGPVNAAIALPTSQSGVQQPLVVSGLSVGVMLTRSADGHYVSLAGYNAATGASNPTNSTDPVVVARIDSNGNVDTSTGLPMTTFHAVGAPYSAISGDGGLGATQSGGIWYVPFGADAGPQIFSENVRDLGISSGQLYGTGNVAYQGSDASPEFFAVNGNLPSTGPQSVTVPSNFPPQVMVSTASPWQFALLDLLPSVPGVDTLYIATDTALDAGAALEGIQRWTFNGTTWSQTGTLGLMVGGSPTVGFRGLAALNVNSDGGVGGSAIIVATTAEAAATTPNRIVLLTDDGVSNPWAGTATVIAQAPANEFFRGVALPPH